MADLTNSQRISYKATYCQLGPVGAGQGAGQGGEAGGSSTSSPPTLMRAVEKTAFVQSLKILPHELDAVRKQLAPDSGSGTATSSLSAALAAVEQLIGDSTATSTLNNASRFAAVSLADLAAVAKSLAAFRDSVGQAIISTVSQILSAHRNSLVTPVTATSSPKAPGGRAATKGASPPQPGTAPSGIPTLSLMTQTSQASSKGRGAAKPKVTTSGSSIHVWIDDSRRAPPAFSPVLAMDAGTTYAPSNSAALAWAEKFQPKLFAGLVGQLQPYTGLSAPQQSAVGQSTAVNAALSGLFTSTLNTNAIQGATNGFQARMAVEPVGNLHLERVEMYPAGIERGELAHSVPLAPGETVNISHKEWSVTEREFEDIVQDYFEGYSEQGVADKNDMAMSTDSQSQHATALNVGASLSASYGSVTLSSTFGYNTNSNDTKSRKDSRNHSMEITKKASARTKKDHKMTFKVTSVAGSQDQAVRIISNPSTTNAMRIDYFQLARKWHVDLLRYGLRLTYDIVIPNPGSGIVTLVEDLKALDALIATPFAFSLPLSAITYNALAPDPTQISNYDQLAADYGATVLAPPEAKKFVTVHRETQRLSDSDYELPHFDSLEFDIDDGYYIADAKLSSNSERQLHDSRSFIIMLDSSSLNDGMNALIGESGHLSFDIQYQYIYDYAISVTFTCLPKAQVIQDWRLQVWTQLRQAAEEQYNKNLQNYKDQQARLMQQIADYDALTLRRMEQEEIMKGVLRWLLGPQFQLVPFDLSILFRSDSSDPEVGDVLDPNQLSEAQWQDVMEHGEFIKYLHNAIEWENVLFFTYPYFWDDNRLWDFKKFLYHPDPTHRTFLRAGAARVVLTIRPGFENSFTSLVESGAFNGLPGAHPYVTIAQELQDFANTNYPGFPPANPEQNVRPLIYLEQRRVWREMQFIIQLLNAYKTATGSFPVGASGDKVPVADLTPYLNGPVTINGAPYSGINGYNTQSNSQQMVLDPTTPQEALLPTYTAVPVNDLVWGNPYFYKCPGDTGDYDLICYGADGIPGGTDKNADISANAEASLISTWSEYTPTSAMDIGITVTPPNTVPAEPSTEIA
jgi:hypothetical protein